VLRLIRRSLHATRCRHRSGRGGRPLPFPRMSHFQSTLVRVLVIQVMTLALLWLLQSRYTA